MKSWPQVPDPNAKPELIIFLNMGQMINDKTMTVDEVNQFLDGIEGYPVNMRYQSVHKVTDPKSGRSSVHYFRWVDGGWFNYTAQRQADIREIIAGNKPDDLNTQIEKRNGKRRQKA